MRKQWPHPFAKTIWKQKLEELKELEEISPKPIDSPWFLA
jgi:hypothetical protein